MKLTIHKDIKSIIDKQIEEQKTIPTTNDIVEYSALIEVKDGSFNITKHPSVVSLKGLDERCDAIATVCKKFSNLKFLFYPHDSTVHSSNNRSYSVCFSKLRNQNFITIPNLHLLGGAVDDIMNSIKKIDTDFEKKINRSVFVGGPQGKKRGEYVYSLSGNKEHIAVLTNQKIVPIQSQLESLFQINIDGHGMCYDRLYWQMASNSVPVYLDRSKDIVQLHDELIIPNKHYISSTINDWPNEFKEYTKNTSLLQDMVKNGKEFIKDHFLESSQQVSMSALYYVLMQIERQQQSML